MEPGTATSAWSAAKRSAKGVDLLKQAGFKKVHNMKDGITAWSDRVDPTVPKY